MNKLSFFSGCLGLDQGLEMAGFQPLLFCENDKFCKQTINLNRPNVRLIDDILDHDYKSILKHAGLKESEEVDLIVGGPPCQAFSTAGKRASFVDPRGNVFLHFIEIICKINPRFFVIENVRGLLSAALKHRPHNQRGENYAPLSDEEKPGGALKVILDKLRRNGFGVSFNLYNSANYGVPQKRERLIIIGSRDGRKLPYIPPTHSDDLGYGLPEWITFKDVTSDLDNNHHEFVEFSQKRKSYYKLLKAGQNWRDLPMEIQKEAMGKSFFAGGGKTGFYRRIAWNEPSPTLVTHPAMPATDLCHPSELRPLSVEEYKRIQQFPDNYKISGTTLQKYKQIGNAVPVGFGKCIGQFIMNYSEQKLQNYNPEGFNYSRYKNTNDLLWEQKMFGKDGETQSAFDFSNPL